MTSPDIRPDAETFWVDVWIFDVVESNGSLEDCWNKTIKLSYACSEFLFEQMKQPWAGHYSCDCTVGIPELDSKFDDFLQEMLSENKWYNSSKGDAVCLSVEHLQRFRSNNGLFPKEEYLPISKNALTFEDELYDSVANMERLVVFQYGDYMTFPSSVEQFHKEEVGRLTQKDWKLLEKIGLLERNH